MSTPDAAMLWTIWIGSALVWAGLSVIVVRRWKLPQISAGWWILAFAAVLRLGYALLVPPTLSDDIWRYVFDGQTLASGSNPYAMSPEQAIEEAARDSPEAVARVNNPELVTIYQPASQYGFAAVVSVGRWLGLAADDYDGFARLMRVALSLIDLSIVVLLLWQLRELGRSAWWAVMYAWNPLAVIEVAWSGHQDVLGIVTLLLALRAAQKASRSWPATLQAGAWLAMTVAVKPIALAVALPMTWHLLRDRPGLRGGGRVLAAAGVCVSTLAGLYLPLILMDGGVGGMLETSRRFVGVWRFNGSIHPLVEAALGGPAVDSAKPIADVICGGLLLIVLLLGTWFHRVPWRAAMTYFFGLICLSSTVHPWYLLWALALLPVAWAAGTTVVGPAVWVASLTLPWSYQSWLELASGGEFQPSLAVWLMQWIPIYMAVGWGAFAACRQAAPRASRPRPIGGRG